MAGFEKNNPPSKYCLEFHESLDVKNEVLVKLRAKLVPILGNKDNNTEIISQLATTLFFTTIATQPLLTGNHRTQAERMNKLFDLIQECETEQKIVCLEKLCDLENLPSLSKRIREKISIEFPNSVQLRCVDNSQK